MGSYVSSPKKFRTENSPPKKTTETCCPTSPINLPHKRHPHLGGNRFLTFNTAGLMDAMIAGWRLQTCKLSMFRPAKDVLNRNLARAPFIAPYAEGNLDTPSSVSGSLPTSSEGLKGFSSCKWFMFTCFFLNKHQIEDEFLCPFKKKEKTTKFNKTCMVRLMIVVVHMTAMAGNISTWGFSKLPLSTGKT